MIRTPSRTLLASTLLLGLAASASARQAGGPSIPEPNPPTAPTATTPSASSSSNGSRPARTTAPFDLHLGAWTGRVEAGRPSDLAFTYSSPANVILPETAQVILSWQALRGSTTVASKTYTQPIARTGSVRRVTFTQLPVDADVTEVRARIQVIALHLGASGAQTIVPLSQLDPLHPVVTVRSYLTREAEVQRVRVWETRTGAGALAQFVVDVKNVSVAPLHPLDVRLRITYRPHNGSAAVGTPVTFVAPLQSSIAPGATSSQRVSTQAPSLSQRFEVTCDLVRVDGANRVIATLCTKKTFVVVATIN